MKRLVMLSAVIIFGIWGCADNTEYTNEVESQGELEEEIIPSRPAIAKYPVIIQSADDFNYDGMPVIHVLLSQVNAHTAPIVINSASITTETLPASFSMPVDIYKIRDSSYYSLTAYVTDLQGNVLAWTQNPVPALTHGLDVETIEIVVNDVTNRIDSTVSTFECENGDVFSVSNWGDDVIRLISTESNYLLRATPAASGAKYTSTNAEFWSKGSEATIRVGNNDELTCETNNMLNVKAESMLKGAAFRASGNEPGWLAEIFESDDELFGLFRLNYGEELVFVTSTEPGIFAFNHSGTEITLDVMEEECNDTMADQQFNFTTVLTVKGDTFRGCGSSF